MYCYYGTGVDTEAFYEYSGSFDDEPKVTMGDGDGTVNLKSLELCKGFSEEVKAFPGESSRDIRNIQYGPTTLPRNTQRALEVKPPVAHLKGGWLYCVLPHCHTTTCRVPSSSNLHRQPGPPLPSPPHHPSELPLRLR